MAGRLALFPLPAGFPPLISRENDSGLPPVTSEKTTCPSRYYKLFDALISKVVPKITNFFVCFT
jgi:hypothetical protein